MSARKSLREKIGSEIFRITGQMANHVLLDCILRLIRDEQRKKCKKCLEQTGIKK
jgi:hypothetical protein